MTNEEAKEILAIYRFNLIQSISNQLEEDIEALDMAIKALEQQPCEDAISREEAIRVAEQGQIQGYEWQFKKLCNLPSVTPSRSKGKWIQTKDDCDGVNFYDFSFECTECGKEQSFKSNYCPNCGADMESEDKE